MSKLYVCSLLYGCADISRQSLESLLTSKIEEPTTFFVLDNGSPNTEEMAEVLKFAESFNTPHRVETRVNDHNFGVSGGMNCLLKRAFEDPECEWMIYTAQDVVVHPDGIQNLVNRAKRGDVHFVTGSQVKWDMELKEPADQEGIGALFMGHYLTTRHLYDVVGGWDEKIYPAYFEDNDYHARIVQAGFHKAAIGSCLAPCRHKTSETIKKFPELNRDFVKNSRYFREKWGGGPAEVMRRLIAEFGEGAPVKHMVLGEIKDGIHPKSS